MRKVGFLASRKISILSILPTLDWAMRVCKQKILSLSVASTLKWNVTYLKSSFKENAVLSLSSLVECTVNYPSNMRRQCYKTASS